MAVPYVGFLFRCASDPFNRANRELNTRPSFIKLWAAPRQREEPSRSDFRAFCKGNCIVYIDPQIADGIFDV